ncbi:pectinesterase family protein [Edaphobacter aggregans]|uniref:pectinesterase family protein n=1 Tax=Edaphobacter aggregans TaxID=570835 RepID=UPI000557BDDB|nr:pectinesterase family protein [Edaphobacter aggregans]
MRSALPVLLFISTFTTAAQEIHVRVDPSAPHADPGNEDRTVFPTIQNAIDHHPWPAPNSLGKDGKPARVYLEVAPGTYHERVIITQNHPNLTLIGTGRRPEDTVITNSLDAKQAGGTFFTETVQVNGAAFQADNLTFENTAGNTGQAVAIAVRSDRAIFKHCRFLGHQDTLFADYGRQYYLDSYIEGGVDFIFGNAAAVFERSEIHANGPGFLTAQSRTSPDQPTGYVILSSKVSSGLEPNPPNSINMGEGSPAPIRTIFLGRPWRPYSRVVYIHTELPADINPAGWNNWNNPANEKTAFYGEFGNTGPGANFLSRVPWSHRRLTSEQANQFLPQTFLRGTDNWNPIDEAARLP